LRAAASIAGFALNRRAALAGQRGGNAAAHDAERVRGVDHRVDIHGGDVGFGEVDLHWGGPFRRDGVRLHRTPQARKIES
jgi:hypothetical protein